MEGAPKFEEVINPEDSPRKSMILNKLRESGPTPENQKLISEYIDYMANNEVNALDAAKTQISCSDLCIAIGEFDAAEEYLTQAMYHAEQLDDLSLYSLAQEKINQLDKLRLK